MPIVTTMAQIFPHYNKQISESSLSNSFFPFQVAAFCISSLKRYRHTTESPYDKQKSENSRSTKIFFLSPLCTDKTIVLTGTDSFWVDEAPFENVYLYIAVIKND